jgi:alkanesulfonate monooxygenase SsuD/methylene tetrahydromethanopterin reductase-like flavin-dependent oxidoreductase (luciferase family)
MPADRYAAARREILDLRAAAGLGDPFTFSYSCARTRVLTRPQGGWSPPPARPPTGSEFAYAPPPWVDSDNRPRLVGTPDECIGDVRLLEAAGVEHLTLRFGEPGVEQLELFAREVAPAFR